MPTNKSAGIRFRIIDSCLTNTRKRYPTLDNLAQACSEILGKDISVFTIEKDIRAMKLPKPAGFNAPIIYSKQNKGYAYDSPGFSIAELNLEDEEWDALRYASQLLFQYKEVPVFKNFKQAIERINITFNLNLEIEDIASEKYIQFETAVATNGYQWIGDIYKALRKHYALQISYENIYKKETKPYTLIPGLLKEHRNRWYVIGRVEARQDYLTFALDRIQTLEVIEKKQKQRTDFNETIFFKNSTGIMESDGKASKVILRMHEPFDKLITLEPLHASQIITKTYKGGIQIQLEVDINPELNSRILSYGRACIVVAPKSLQKNIKQQLMQTLQQYSK